MHTPNPLATFSPTRFFLASLLLFAAFAVHAPADPAEAPPGWQLAEGHYEGYFPLAVVYPRPDDETPDWARHRHAYPGIRYEIPIGVKFGKWPYRYEKVEGPEWLSIVHETLVWDGVDKFVIPEGYGILAGEAPAEAQAAQRVTVRVYDQDHERPDPSFIDVSFTVTVSPDNFVFVDTINGDDETGDGTLAHPYKELVRPALTGKHANTIVVIRQTAPLDPDENSTDFDPVNNTWSGGYVPDTEFGQIFPRGTRNLPEGTPTPGNPSAFINYPGETVHINLKRMRRFGGIDHDTFYSGLTLAYTNQERRDVGNVQTLIAWHPRRRVTFWNLRFYRPFGGTAKNDNHGAIWFMAGGNPNEDTGHVYIYCVDTEGDRMNVDPHEGAGRNGFGGNGAHLFETYTTSRTLVERNRVRNSRIVNNLFIGPKGESDKYEVRANDTTENNTGKTHIRMAYYTTAMPERGFHRDTVLCFNKSGNLSNTEAAIETGDMSTPDPAVHRGIYVYRNTMPGNMDRVREHEGLVPVASNNIVGSIRANTYREHGNVPMPTAAEREATVDNQMNLVGEARERWLGKKGAEIR